MKQWVLCVVLAVGTGCASVQGSKTRQIDLPKAASINADLGIGYMRQGQLAWAKRKLDKALEQDPKSAKVQNAQAQLLAQMGQPEEAHKAFLKAIKLDPEQAEYANTYGIFLCRQAEFAAAYQHFDSAAENPLYRTPEMALDNAALCAMQERDWQKAQSYAMAALKRAPEFAPASFHLAEILYRSGRPNSAQRYLFKNRERETMNAEQLWLAVQISRALNDLPSVKRYGQTLVQKFPDARETAQLTGLP